MAGRNVNIVGGPTMVTLNPFELLGDPMRAQQNEGSCAVSPRHPLHLLCGANDYRLNDLSGIDTTKIPADAWGGVFQSRDGGLTWQSRLHPGHALDAHDSVLKVFPAMADPVVRIGPGGLGFYSGIAFERGESNLGLLFVSTWMDLLAREGDPEPFKHVRTVMVAGGSARRFIDKPWMALGTPIPGQTCTLQVPAGDGTRVTQRVPRTPVYLAWAAFTGQSESDRSQIYFSRSTDCGATFSRPRLLSAGHRLNQGVQLAVLPGTDTVMVAWRRGASGNQSDALIVRTSRNGGQSFGPAIPVAATAPAPAQPQTKTMAGGLAAFGKSGHGHPHGYQNHFDDDHDHHDCADDDNDWPRAKPVPAAYCAFDQGTTEFTFRTTGFPTLTAGPGRFYMAWAQRQGNCSFGVARVVLASSSDGFTWTAPVIVDNPSVPAHQIMPTASVVGNTLRLAWFDFRNDASRLFGPFIEEQSIAAGNSPPPAARHTADVWGAQATLPLGSKPVFTAYPVSQYIFGTPAGSTERRQLQFNPVNVRMFKKMTVPFISDYMDIAASHYAPLHPVLLPGVWAPNVGQHGDTPSLVTWTDQRNVKLFPNEDYTQPRPYTRPDLPGLGSASISDPLATVPPCTPDYTGTKNQDIFAAPVLPHGWFAAAAWNNKAQGYTTRPLPNGGVARELMQRAYAVFVRNVTAAPKSFSLAIANQPLGGRASFDQFVALPVIAITVPARSMVARTVYVEAPLRRAPVAVDVAETAAAGRMRVWLNPDPSAPDSLLLPVSVPPQEPAFDIANFEVYDVGVGAPTIKNTRVSGGHTGWPSPEWENPEWENPEWENPEWQNPEWQNPEWENPEWQNPEWENPEWENPEWENPEWENGTLTDEDLNGSKVVRQFRWRIDHQGNTSAAFSTKAAVLAPTADLKFQMVVYKLYTTPVTTGCQPNLVGHTQVLSNVVALDVSVENFQAPEWENSAHAAHFWLEPGEDAYVALQIIGTPQAVAAIGAGDVVLGSQPQAVNTVDRRAGRTEPRGTISQIGILAATLPDADRGQPYAAAPLQAVFGTAPYTWSWAGDTPDGLAIDAASGVISGTPTEAGVFSFVVTVTDAGVPARSASRAFTLTIEGAVVPLLSWVVEPVTAVGGQPIRGDDGVLLRVRAQDASGAVLPGVAITLSVGDNPGNGALSGATTALTDEAGIATFANVHLNRGGPGYSLLASAPGAESEESDTFHVIGFAATAAMPGGGRTLHSATRLPDGRVLIAGGRAPSADGGALLGTALLFNPDPAHISNPWTTTGPLNDPRQEHTATLLDDGRVLIAGGLGDDGPLNSAEIYDPATNTFSYTEEWVYNEATGEYETVQSFMNEARRGHAATSLRWGGVLLTGGDNGRSGVTATAETTWGDVFYNTNSPMGSARTDHAAVRRSDDHVSILGGRNGSLSLASVETYDRDYEVFRAEGTLNQPRHGHAAVILPNGGVLVAGGSSRTALESPPATLASAEVYSTGEGESADVAPMAVARRDFAALMLANGTVLVAGGQDGFEVPTTHDSAELYVADAEQFFPTGSLVVPRRDFTATLLDDGRVLVVGGSNSSDDALASAEIYYPVPTGSVTDAAGDSSPGHFDLVRGQAAIDGDTLRFSLRFATDDTNYYDYVQVLIDTDQNPATGHQGSDPDCSQDVGLIGAEFVAMWQGEGGAMYPYGGGGCGDWYWDGATYLNFSFTEGAMEILVPLSALADDGKVNFKVVVARPEWVCEDMDGECAQVFEVFDFMPDVGQPPGKLQ